MRALSFCFVFFLRKKWSHSAAVIESAARTRDQVAWSKNRRRACSSGTDCRRRAAWRKTRCPDTGCSGRSCSGRRLGTARPVRWPLDHLHRIATKKPKRSVKRWTNKKKPSRLGQVSKIFGVLRKKMHSNHSFKSKSGFFVFSESHKLTLSLRFHSNEPVSLKTLPGIGMKLISSKG